MWGTFEEAEPRRSQHAPFVVPSSLRGWTWLVRIGIAALMLMPGLAQARSLPTEITYFLAAPDEVFAQLAAEFDRENPDITVKGLFASDMKTGSALDALLTLTAGGTPPDVIIMVLGWYMPLGRQGLLEDLSRYLSSDPVYQQLRPKLFTNILERFVTPDQRLFALPVDINFRMLFYNRDHFDQAGLPYPTESMTFSDFVASARRLTQQRADGTVTRWGFSGFSGPPSTWITWVHGNGGKVVDRPVAPTRSTFSSPATLEAVKMLIDMIHSQRAAPVWQGGTFGSRQASMSLDWIEVLYNYEQLPDLNYAITTQPVVREPYSAMAVRFVGIHAGSREKQAAYRFARYLATDPRAQRLLGVRKVSWVRSVATDPQLLNTPPNRNKAAVLQAIPAANLIYPLTEHWTEIEPIYNQFMRRILAREIPLESAALQIDQAINAILAAHD